MKEYLPKSMLVTGGAGFIGSHYVNYVLAKYPQLIVVNLDLLTYAGSLENLSNLPDTNRHHFIKGDIRNRKLLDETLRQYNIDTIVHFAAESHVDRSIENPAIFVETNVLGTLVLLEAAKAYWLEEKKLSAKQCRFHHISTDEVYGTLTEKDPAFTEKTPYAPNSPYSASKAGSDHLVRAYFETYQLPITITNCSNNYGQNQHPEKFIPTIIRSCLDQKPIPVYGNGKNRRDWLYVEDHCEAINTVICKGKLGENYNIGGNAEYENLEIVQEICHMLDEMIPAEKPYAHLISFVTDRPGHDWRYAMDIEKITKELDWTPRTPLQEGLSSTIKYLIKNHHHLLKRIEQENEKKKITKRKIFSSSAFKGLQRKARLAIHYILSGDLKSLVRGLKKNFFPDRVSEKELGKKLTPEKFAQKLHNSHKNLVLLIDHNLGGGANFYRKKLIPSLLKEGRAVILIYYDLANFECLIKYLDCDEQIDLYTKMNNLNQVTELFLGLKPQEIIFNNGVSYDSPLSVPTFLVNMVENSGADLTLLVHDYFIICPSYTLLDYQEKFCGIPDIKECHLCLPKQKDDFVKFFNSTDIDAWREKWSLCVNKAKRIVCFSEASKELLSKAYPFIDQEKIVVKPHTVDYIHRKPTLTKSATLHIGIVGNINKQKGAKIIKEMLDSIKERAIPVKITLIGEIHHSIKSPYFSVLGKYKTSELPDLIEKSGANIFFFPSIWPETFSYVTEELIQMGVPLAVFDLGAPAERIRHYQHGMVIKKIDATYALEQLLAFHKKTYPEF